MENHVGMDCCMLCGEPKSIALATKYKTVNGKMQPKHPIPQRFASGPELCDKCLEKMKTDNTFVMYEAEQVFNHKHNKHLPEFTGRYLIVNFEAISKDFESYDFVDKNRFILCKPQEFNKFINQGENNG